MLEDRTLPGQRPPIETHMDLDGPTILRPAGLTYDAPGKESEQTSSLQIQLPAAATTSDPSDHPEEHYQEDMQHEKDLSNIPAVASGEAARSLLAVQDEVLGRDLAKELAAAAAAEVAGVLSIEEVYALARSMKRKQCQLRPDDEEKLQLWYRSM
jgi:hypothetical protein